MSDNAQIVLIIAVALIVVLFIFRKQLSDFHFKGGKDGVDMLLKTRKDTPKITSNQTSKASTGTSVIRNKLWGRGNKINVQTGGRAPQSVEDNQMIGEEQEINVTPQEKKRKMSK